MARRRGLGERETSSTRNARSARSCSSPRALSLSQLAPIVLCAYRPLRHRRRTSGLQAYERSRNIAAYYATLAITVRRDPLRVGLPVPLRAEPHAPPMAVGDMREFDRRQRVDCRLAPAFVVGCQFRDIQRDVRFAWRRYRVHGVDVAVDNHRAHGRRDQCRDGAPDGVCDGWRAQTHEDAGSENGRRDRRAQRGDDRSSLPFNARVIQLSPPRGWFGPPQPSFPRKPRGES